MAEHRKRQRRAAAILGGVAVAAVATWGIVAGVQTPDTGPGSAASLSAPVTESVRTLDQLRVAPDVLTGRDSGYDRDAQFGKGWPSRGQGCDLRDEILRRDLAAVTYKPGSSCDVAAGGLNGTTRSAEDVEIDHVVPLRLAWSSGAASWGQDKRRAFATDPIELRAELGSANGSNGELGPEASDPGGDRCRYAQQYVATAGRYGLTVTLDRKFALRRLLDTC